MAWAFVMRIFEDEPSLVGTPTVAHFVKVTEDKLAALGLHDSVGGGKNMIVTDYEGFKSGDNDIHNDILLDTKQ